MKNSAETLAKRNALRKYWRETIPSDSFPHKVTKKCKECGKVRPHSWCSSFTQGGKPEYRSRCDQCMARYHSDRRKGARAQTTTLALDRKAQRKARAVAYLGGKCRACGYDRCIKAMTFHHREPEEKAFSVSQMLDRSWEVLRRELDKCDLLCFNCHMEEHCGLDREARTGAGAPRRNACTSHWLDTTAKEEPA